MARFTCNYQFPIHPSEMFACTTGKMSDATRMLRVEMIRNLSALSQSHDQDTLDNKIFIDVHHGNIVGMDMNELTMPGMNMCLGNNRVALKNMTAHNWKTMKMQTRHRQPKQR